MPFTVSLFPDARSQLRALAQRARDFGVFPAFSAAMRRIDQYLKNEPLQWGDPEYNLKHEGGRACHGLVDRLLVRFAVFENEQKVLVLGIKPLSGSPLADD